MRSLVTLADDLALKTATTRVAKLLWERARAAGGRGGREIRLPRTGLREDEMGAITLGRDAIRIADMNVLEGFVGAVEAHERRPSS
jgi:hypothetical protein